LAWIEIFYERGNGAVFAVARIRDCASVMQSLLESAEYLGAVVEVADTMTKCLRSGNKILFFGNGGSARTPSTWRRIERTVSQRAPSLSGWALTTNTSVLTAIATIILLRKCSRARSRESQRR